ncbi:flagellar motor switch protein FliM [Frigoribacterium salinisoli]
MTLLDPARPGTPTRSSSGPSATPERVVEPYDFRRPTTLAREHARVLEVAFDTFARQWGTQLTAKMRVRSEVTSHQVQMLTYDDYASSLPATTAMVLCPLASMEAKAVVQFPTWAAFVWVSHLLGAPKPGSLPDRTFTPVEEALVRNIVEDALDDLSYSFGALLVDDVRVGGFQYDSQFAQVAAKSDSMIVASLKISVGNRVATGTMAIPARALLPQLIDDDGTQTTLTSRELVEQQLAAVPVDVALRIAPVTVRPAEVLGLAVGDLLPLPHPQHRPLEMTVDGVPVGRAAVGANGSRLAGVVVSVTTDLREGTA